ncbi:sugar transferase [Deinococcus sp. RIT780]|uniref:sugar transferase n=3 Tax=unclassified Deinococcus TaxID=2623546 RepID=UPI001C8AEEA0|nr:sugar transferase [Deinococcus sp. RIT780]MBX8464019.1 sugar transferase [Deinococcus sp. RIT780]
MTVTQSVRDEILRHPGPTLIESGVDTAGPVASPVVRARVPTTGALDRRTSMNGVALAAGDAAALWLLLGLTLTPALGGQGGHAWQTVFICTWVIASLTFRSYPGYGMDSSERLRRSVICACAAVPSLIGAAVEYTPTTLAGAVTLLLIAPLSVPLVLLTQSGVRALLRAANRWGVDVAVIGDGEAAATVTDTLRRDWSLGYRPLDSGDANLAILAMPNIPYALRDRLLDGPLARFRRVLVMVTQPASDTRWAGSHQLGTISVLEVRRRHLEPGDLRQKRALDLLIAALLFPFFTPLLLIVALVVALDSRGPVLYGATRLGWRGRPFTCWKFRTMHGDGEQKLAELLARDPQARAHYAQYHKLPSDPRVTRAGHFLRRSSLDELPQLLNVLTGEMSLVGPRPYLQREVPDMNPHTDVILSCRPGITGLWQVSGRSGTSFQERVQLDLQYVRRWSPWLDLTLLFATLEVVVRRRGAL